MLPFIRNTVGYSGSLTKQAVFGRRFSCREGTGYKENNMAKGIRKQGAASIMASGFFRLAVYACIIFAVIFVGKSAYDFGYAIFNEVPMAEGEGTDITVVIKDGSSVYQIGKILKKKG